MTVDPGDFRRTVGHFATGVTVVTAAVEGAVHAMTANAFTSVSLDPLLVLVALAKRARMAAVVDQARGFAVNVLREDQAALSSWFAGAWSEAERPPFRFLPWSGGPRLEGAAAAIGCLLADRLEGGDHWLVLGRVQALHVGVEPVRPLVFHGGRYCALAREEGTAAPDLEGTEQAQVFYDSW
jgi:flavin reductase (DIM6/NTAB) family NADH-FMN oxidoreductase RutF